MTGMPTHEPERRGMEEEVKAPIDVEVVLGPLGRGSVKVGGMELADQLRSLLVIAEAGELTRVLLEFHNVTVRVDAAAEVLAADGGEDGEEIAINTETPDEA